MDILIVQGDNVKDDTAVGSDSVSVLSIGEGCVTVTKDGELVAKFYGKDAFKNAKRYVEAERAREVTYWEYSDYDY